MLTPPEGPNATKTGRRWFLNLPSLSHDFTHALRDRSEDKVMLVVIRGGEVITRRVTLELRK